MVWCLVADLMWLACIQANFDVRSKASAAMLYDLALEALGFPVKQLTNLVVQKGKKNEKPRLHPLGHWALVKLSRKNVNSHIKTYHPIVYEQEGQPEQEGLDECASTRGQDALDRCCPLSTLMMEPVIRNDCLTKTILTLETLFDDVVKPVVMQQATKLKANGAEFLTGWLLAVREKNAEAQDIFKLKIGAAELFNDCKDHDLLDLEPFQDICMENIAIAFGRKMFRNMLRALGHSENADRVGHTEFALLLKCNPASEEFLINSQVHRKMTEITGDLTQFYKTLHLCRETMYNFQGDLREQGDLEDDAMFSIPGSSKVKIGKKDTYTVLSRHSSLKTSDVATPRLQPQHSSEEKSKVGDDDITAPRAENSDDGDNDANTAAANADDTIADTTTAEMNHLFEEIVCLDLSKKRCAINTPLHAATSKKKPSEPSSSLVEERHGMLPVVPATNVYQSPHQPDSQSPAAEATSAEASARPQDQDESQSSHFHAVSQGKAGIQELNIKIGTLSEKIEQLKMESKTFLDNRYVQFKVQLNVNHIVEIKLQALVGTMEQLSSRVENDQTKPELQNSTGELKSLSTQLQEMKAKLHIIKQLVSIDQMLNLARQELGNKHYFKVAQILRDVRQMLKTIKDQDNLDILTGLKREAVFRGELFLYELNNIWRDSVACEAEHNNTEEYVIRIDISNQTSLGELLQALYLYDELDLKLKLFSEKLTENVMLVLMQKQCVVRVEGSGGLMVMRVCVEGQDKNTPVTVISNTEKVFFCLSNVFNMTVNPSDGTTFMNLLGKVMADDFCDLFIKEILWPAIPCTNEQRLAYDAVVEHTTKLQNYLQSIGFFNGGNESLLEYAKNVDVHFTNKQCDLTMSEARSIMKKDLHDSVEVSPQVCTSLGLTDESTMDSGHTDSLESYPSLSSSTLAFPKCVISKSVVELLLLLQNLLKECSSSSELQAVRLYCTARKIIEMYCSITPVHHKKSLDTLPQQAALLHNNCMYLAHQLLLLGPEFHEQLCQVMPSQSLTFIDLTCKLRQTGSQAFLGQMQVQKKQLFEILRDSGLSNLGEGDRLSVNTEKYILQCFQEIELLQRVWQNVLPTNMYNKAIGTLLNTLVEELVVRVCTAEDIPAETATDLVSVFTTVLDRAPRVFMENEEVHHYVNHWRTLQELVLVLGADLQGIDHRWAYGKGPLAHEFRPDQVKQLVCALFQNTTRRADVLSKIK